MYSGTYAQTKGDTNMSFEVKMGRTYIYKCRKQTENDTFKHYLVAILVVRLLILLNSCFLHINSSMFSIGVIISTI